MFRSYQQWKSKFPPSRQMLADLAANVLIVGMLYCIYMLTLDEAGFNWKRLVFGSLFFGSLLTRSLSWKNIRSLFRSSH